MSGRATIDLGIYSHRQAAEVAPEVPWLTRARRVRLLRWAVAALLVALGLPLAGAAAEPTPPLVPLWTVPGGPLPNVEVAVGAEDLYAVTSTASGPALTAYRLADGTIRWEVPLEVPTLGAVFVETMAGLPVVYTMRPIAFTAVYDPETAQLRWSGEGYPAPLANGLVSLHSAPTGPADPAESSEAVMEIRELGSGRAVTPVDSDGRVFGYQEAADGPPHLVGLGRDGVLASYDVITGRVSHSRSTPHVEPLDISRRTSVSVFGNVVLVADRTGVTAELAAYDATTLELRWSIMDAQSADRCGPLVCVQIGGASADAPGELHGVDPVTGTSRWSMDCADGGGPDRCFMNAREVGSPDRLLVQVRGLDQQQGETLSWNLLVDAGTGRWLTEPTEWAVWSQAGSGALLSLTTDRFWLARSDLDQTRIEVLGAVEADWCQPQLPYLVCHTQGAVEVWRFGP